MGSYFNYHVYSNGWMCRILWWSSNSSHGIGVALKGNNVIDLDNIYCQICEVTIEENVNFKDYKYIHILSGEPWCDECTYKRDIY
jgi:hypothetical protein